MILRYHCAQLIAIDNAAPLAYNHGKGDQRGPEIRAGSHPQEGALICRVRGWTLATAVDRMADREIAAISAERRQFEAALGTAPSRRSVLLRSVTPPGSGRGRARAPSPS